jgi:hypothetical protein
MDQRCAATMARGERDRPVKAAGELARDDAGDLAADRPMSSRCRYDQWRRSTSVAEERAIETRNRGGL